MLQAIETRYNGYRFRSRLEARWAVFFDTLGIKYEYEKEGFDLTYLLNPEYELTIDKAPDEEYEVPCKNWREVLGAGPVRYLPDFWLPDLNAWVEIKGQEPTKKEDALAEMLAHAGNHDVFLFHGDLFVPGPYDYGGTPSYMYFADGGCDMPYFWCECGVCGKFGVEFDGRSDRLSCKESYDRTKPGCPRSGGNRDRGHNGCSDRLVAAYTAARSARFEFGESGR